MSHTVPTGAPIAFELLFQSAQGIFHAYKSQTTANALPMWKAQASHVITSLSHGIDAISSNPAHLQLLLGDVSRLQAQLISICRAQPQATPLLSPLQPLTQTHQPLPHHTTPHVPLTKPYQLLTHPTKPHVIFSRPLYSRPKPPATTRAIHPLPQKPTFTSPPPPPPPITTPHVTPPTTPTVVRPISTPPTIVPPTPNDGSDWETLPPTPRPSTTTPPPWINVNTSGKHSPAPPTPTPPVIHAPQPITPPPRLPEGVTQQEMDDYLAHQATYPPMPTPPPRQPTPPSPQYQNHLPPWAQRSPVYNSLPLVSLTNIVGKLIPDPTIDDVADTDLFATIPSTPPILPIPTLPTIATRQDKVVTIQFNGVPCRLQPDAPIYTSAELLRELWQQLTNANIIPFDTPHPFQLSRFPCWMNPKPKHTSSFTIHIIDDSQSTHALKLFYNQHLIWLFCKNVKIVLPDF